MESLCKGFVISRMYTRQASKFGSNPPNATKAREGSKVGEPGRARKFWILEGWSMPARARPNAKWTAMAKEEIDLYHGRGTTFGMMYR